MKTLDEKLIEAMGVIERFFEDHSPYHGSIMRRLYMRSPDIGPGMSPKRAAQTLLRQIRSYSRRREYVYGAEVRRFDADDGRVFIAARLDVLK